MVHLSELDALGDWAETCLRDLVASAAADEVLQQWNASMLDVAANRVTMREVVDGWRGWILLAGFGDEFVYEPQTSQPNRYWDPAVTRLWNHHRIASALIEVWMIAGDAATCDPAEVVADAPWNEPLTAIEEIGQRLAVARRWQAAPTNRPTQSS